MEVEKRQAVENEDYDKAKLKKVQMDEYRLQVYKELNLNDLLEVTGVSAQFQLITIFIFLYFAFSYLLSNNWKWHFSKWAL